MRLNLSDGDRPDTPILVYGEVLFDCFPDGAAVLGGAPFNVAWHLRALGADPLLITRVGGDAEGAAVQRAMRANGLRDLGVQHDAQRPTGRVTVTLVGGEPQFHIAAEQAYDYIDAQPALAVAAAGGVLYHGTLALRNAVSRAALDALCADPARQVFLDINLRAPWWRAADLPALVRRAQWLKLNAAELQELAGILAVPAGAPETQAQRLREQTGVDVILVTCGADGAFAVTAEQVERVTAAANVAVVDTVGAGDAFSAICLLGITEHWSLPLTLNRAQSFAERICGLRGATTADPGFYAEVRNAWNG